jgi:protein-L-isoaspartate(D-aspartate) O-methyltransferase
VVRKGCLKGWIIPPPAEPVKTKEQLRIEREKKAVWLVNQGFLRSGHIRSAMLKVPREDFIPDLYRDYAYEEVPLPLPGEESTISCPHSYPLFYEPLGLDRGHRFLEVGLGSGYGTALAREIVGEEGLVVSIEIDPLTFAFAESNLMTAGYSDIVLVRGDGSCGFPEEAPYDRICITAACDEVPHPLLDQLKTGGKLIAPVKEMDTQDLILLEKGVEGVNRRTICEVLYISLR